MPRSRFYKTALWRYDADELAKIAIRVAPTLIIPAICDVFIPLAPYRIDINHVTDKNFAMIDLRGTPDNDLVHALKAGFFKAYNPLEDQILRITSLHSDYPTPRFKGIIRAHDISKPRYQGIINRHEILGIVCHNADKYMEFMNRIVRGPSCNKDLLTKVETEARANDLATLEPACQEDLCRFFATSSARYDLATVYKNYLGLPYPDCKDVSICFGYSDPARKSDPQEAADTKALGFRGVMTPIEYAMFYIHLQMVCNAELFDDHVVRMTTNMPSTMAHHVTYLGMAMFQCGLSEQEGRDAITKCQELRDAIKEIVLELPLAGEIVNHPDVLRSLEKCYDELLE